MNPTLDSLRERKIRLITLAIGLVAFMLGAILPALAANETWSGNGTDRSWKTPGNWVGGVAPLAGDSLFFGGTTHTTTTNNFAADTAFNSLTFDSPAGFFVLAGNEVALGGNITNNQVVTPETISLPLLLSATPTLSIVPNGVLSINGVISGGGGLAVVGGGSLNLSGNNTFTGNLTVNNSSTVFVGKDANLGAGSLILNNGTLSATTNLALSTGRGIAVGPGWGGLSMPVGSILSYGGVIANNGGAGGLSKSGYGTLSLSGANTYTGPTTNAIGTLVLDFTQAGSPIGGIINSSSSLELGGGNSGGGVENVAQLIMSGGVAADVQNFNGTFSTFGGSAIVATNKAGGTVNLGLGALSHSPGGTIAFVTPQASGGGHVTTTSPNVNGILGGYALIGGDANAATTFAVNGHTLITGTNFAAVDGSGNIVNYTGYSNVTASSFVASQVAGSSDPNIAINDVAAAAVVNIAADNAGTTIDINAIKWTTFSGGFDSISIGAGNTLRLGQFGGIIRNGPSTGNAVYIGGVNSTPQTASGTTGSSGIGTLTAGGPNPNTPGEIVIAVNNASETSGTTIFEPTIADNGTGPVTVVKMGPGSIKLDGHNTFSGGLYLLQGRVQFAGSEIGSANPDGGGLGPIFVLPGAYLFPSGAAAITNAMFVAGAGDAAEPLGAFRGGTYSGVVTLIGDANFGGNAILNGPVVGPFSVTLGSAATVNGGATLNNPANNWTGNTFMTARNNTGANTVTCGANNVIPNGFGYGNVTLQSFSTGTITWNLNGFNQTVNGLLSTGPGTTIFIQNSASGTNATLSVGNNDQSGIFSGVIQDGSAQVALTKIGGGIETLNGANTYTGSTIINGGTLAVSDPGSISTSANIAVNTGATLDVTGSSAFSTVNPVQLIGGTLAGNGTVGPLTMNNGDLTLDLNPATVNVTAGTLTLGGSSNVVNISTVNNVPGYPALFTLIQYSGVLAGGMNFVIGDVPNASTGGYVSNDVVHSRIVLVLTNGPAQLTWVGGDAVNPTFWDDSVTTNWLAFKGTPNQVASPFLAADPVIFDDTALTSQVNLKTAGLLPAFMTFNNNTLNYTLSGVGAVGGAAPLLKNGNGSLTLLNTGGDSYRGGVTVNGGSVVFGANNFISGGVSIASGASVQVGLNGGAGTLPGGNVTDGGSLIFNRGANLTVPNAISGAGTVTKQDTGVLTLSGNNGTLSGPINTLAGTLQAGSGNALGTGFTTISSGSTLDVNGQTLNTTAQVTVSGTGVGGKGAIINSGAASQNALGSVTLAGNTTFGGTNRWDIRGGTAQLATSPANSPYSLTKVGPNFIGLVGLTVDSALANIDIQQGTLDYEGATAGLGDPNGTLTVENGATLELFGSTSALNKNIVLNGTGTNDTLLCASGVLNSIVGQITVNGTCVFDATSGTELTLNNIIGGGSVIKTGPGTNLIVGGFTASYTGGTIISNGTLVVNGTVSSVVQVVTNGTLAGTGTVGANVSVLGGNVSPGDIVSSAQALLTVGNLTLNNATATFELSSSPSSGNDVLTAGTLTLNGTNTLQIAPLTFMNVGDTYTLINYTGATLPSSATNQLKIVPSRNFFSFVVVDPSTTPGQIQIKVLAAVGNDIWTGAKSSTWDITTTNWTRNGSPVNFNDGDFVTFDDSSTVTTVNLTGARTISGLTEQSFSATYTLSGTGNLTGPGGLDLEGNSMKILNSGSNDFTGPIFINFGILQVGNGSTNGNLGSGVITNGGSLVFNRSDTNVVANVIRGTGSLTNLGTGMLTLSGANAFDGQVTIVQGTVRALNSTALGSVFGGTVVSNGATLDITNNANLGKEPITASGAGVGGKGAIINGSGNPGFVAANFNQLTITTNIVIGGPGRLDFRASSATAQDAALNTTGGSPSLIKLGTNLLQMAGVQIDPTLGDILVGAGTLGFQWQIPSLGDPARTLSVSNGAAIGFFDMSNAVSKVLILNDGASVLGQDGTNNNEFDGPVTLNGSNTFNISSGTLLFANAFGGSGNLVKTGTGNLILSLVQAGSGSETYAGKTFVNQGTLTLTDNASLTNSAAIVLVNSTLNVTGRVDATLTLGVTKPQILAGGGAINGALVVNSGSTINPGNITGTGVLNVSNAVTLSGNIIMDLNRSAGAVTNDQIIAPSIAVSGPLTVTNVGPDLLTGNRFQLFSLPVAGFASVSLPLANVSGNKVYQWRNDLSVNGSITLTNVIVSGPSTNANITSVSLSGTNLLVHGTNNNVPNTNFHYVVFTSTNILTALSNWTPVLTNTYNSDGTFDYTNPVVPGTPQQFIDVQAVP